MKEEEKKEKKIPRKKVLPRRQPRARKSAPRPEKPAFAEEKKIFKKRSFSGQYLSFRRGGLGIFDSFFNSFYITLTERSLEKEKRRLQKKGKAQDFSHLDHHSSALRVLSFLPRKFGVLQGKLASLWSGEGKGKYSKREFVKTHKTAFLLLGFAFAIALFAAIQLSRPVVLRAEIDGKVIGIVESKNLVDSAVNQLEDNVEIILGKNFHFPYKISYTFARQWGKTLTDKSKISETLYTYVTDYICTASGLYVDDVLVAVCRSEEELHTGLQELVANFAAPGETGIFNETRVVTQAYPTESILEKDAYFSLLKEMLIPLEERKKENVETDSVFPEKSENASEGESIPAMAVVSDFSFVPDDKKISKSNYPEPIDQIKLDFYRSEYRNYETTLPYQTVYLESAEHYTSMVDTTVPGANGIATVEEEIFYVNGKEAGRSVLNQIVKKAPVNRVVSIGTKLLPEERKDFDPGDRRFIVPKVGEVNYYYGYRESGMHYGWDIPGDEGDNLYAAASGKVVVAIGQNGAFSNRPANHFSGYGYCVVIEHEDGFSTMYAHCSKIFVQLGQEVKQGEKIAAVGNTGRSDGNHVHFEIEKNGRKLDPARYLYQGKTTIYD